MRRCDAAKTKKTECASESRNLTLTCIDQIAVNFNTFKTHSSHCCYGDVVGSPGKQGDKGMTGVWGPDVSTSAGGHV